MKEKKKIKDPKLYNTEKEKKKLKKKNCRIKLQASKLKVNLMIYLNADNPGTDPSPERDMPAMIISLVAVKQRDVILSTVKQQQMEQTLSQGK